MNDCSRAELIPAWSRNPSARRCRGNINLVGACGGYVQAAMSATCSYIRRGLCVSDECPNCHEGERRRGTFGHGRSGAQCISSSPHRGTEAHLWAAADRHGQGFGQPLTDAHSGGISHPSDGCRHSSRSPDPRLSCVGDLSRLVVGRINNLIGRRIETDYGPRPHQSHVAHAADASESGSQNTISLLHSPDRHTQYWSDINVYVLPYLCCI